MKQLTKEQKKEMKNQYIVDTYKDIYNNPNSTWESPNKNAGLTDLQIARDNLRLNNWTNQDFAPHSLNKKNEATYFLKIQSINDTLSKERSSVFQKHIDNRWNGATEHVQKSYQEKHPVNTSWRMSARNYNSQVA